MFSIMVSVIGNEIGNVSSNPGWSCLHFISLHFGKGMNPSILPQLWVDRQTGFFNFCEATGLGKGNSKFKPALLC